MCAVIHPPTAPITGTYMVFTDSERSLWRVSFCVIPLARRSGLKNGSLPQAPLILIRASCDRLNAPLRTDRDYPV